MDAEMKNALISIMCDMERRCKDLVCSVPDDASSARLLLWNMKEIIDNSIMALDSPEKAESLNKVLEWIKGKRLKEYERTDEKAETEREKA